MNPRALGFLLLSAWPLMAATPHLANLAVAVARNPGDGVAAARLGAALALQDWMLPSAPPARVRPIRAARNTPRTGCN